jgi:hypothetical protein
MTKKMPLVIVDKNSTYGKKPPPVITSQGTPEHKKDPIYTMSAHDKAELFIAKMNAIRLEKIKTKPQKQKSKIETIKKNLRGVKK